MTDLTDPNALTEWEMGVVTDETLTIRMVNRIASGAVSPDELGSINVYAGAAYLRKGYPQIGAVSRNLDKSSYRNNDLHYVIRAEIIIPDYMLRDEDKALINSIAEYEEKVERDRLEAERQEKLDQAARLREQAAALEAQAAELEKAYGRRTA